MTDERSWIMIDFRTLLGTQISFCVHEHAHAADLLWELYDDDKRL